MLNLTREFIQKIEQKFEKPNIVDTSVYLTNFFLKNHYYGYESDLILKEYADFIWLDLSTWLMRNYHYIKTDKKFHTFNFQKSIDNAKESTYDWRRELYWKWLIKDTSNDIISKLRTIYPFQNSKNEVKRILGLTAPKEE